MLDHLATGSLLLAGVAPAGEAEEGGRERRHCSATANAQLTSCRYEVRDDFFKAKAICINVLDAAERKTCFEDAEDARDEGELLCREQRKARGHLCMALGEDRYDPDFDPALFDDPRNPTHPNPWFPLTVGNRWTFVWGDETVTIEVLDETKLIEGVHCIVVNDVVTQDGKPIEDTDDWFGQRKDGTVDYCGESVRDFETFEGDDPEEPELVSIDGSWKAGRDGDLPGTQFLATPEEGVVYRQEFSAGNAEDAAIVLSAVYGFGDEPELDTFVPRRLAEILCANHDCVVTGEFNPTEPGGFQRKYYAKGIGLFLEVNPRSANVVQLHELQLMPAAAAALTR